MKKKTILFLVLLLLFLILLVDYSYLQEKEKEGQTCFFSGNDYLDLTDNNKVFYVTGLIDMWFYVAHSDMPVVYSIFIKRMKNITMIQARAIFDKYLEEHPELWNFTAASIFFGAIEEIILDNVE